MLPSIAVQFGQATGNYGALRDAIGKMTDHREGGRKYEVVKPDVTDYQNSRVCGDPHKHGATLVSAVFDAFMRIYSRRALDANSARDERVGSAAGRVIVGGSR